MTGPSPTPGGRSVSLRWLAAVLIVAVTAGRLLYLFFLCPYDLAPDEAHYWDWSRHLDWSYYSKGPVVAWTIRAACEVLGGTALAADGTLMPAVRAPAVLFGGGLLAGLYVLTWQTFRGDRLALAVILTALAVPPLTAGSLVMTIDSPFLCCWTWALVFGRWAMIDGKAWAWPAAGALVALGVLAKYTMALWLVSAGLFVLFTPTHRGLLVRPGFWAMAVVGGLSAVPVLYWNSQHEWVTFRHVAVQAGVESPAAAVRWPGPLEYLGGQFALLLGFGFVAWVAALVRFRPRPGGSAGTAYLWWMSLPTFLVFAASSLRARGQLNWPVAAYLAGAVLVAGWLSELLTGDRPGRKRAARWGLAVAVALGGLLTILAHDTRLFTGPIARLAPAWLTPADAGGVPSIRALDPAARMKGSRYLGQELDALRAEVRAADGADPVLAGMRWDVPGLIGFYADGHPQVYSVGVGLGADRHSQYDLWRPNPVDDPDVFRGRTFLVVGAWDPGALLAPAFDSVSASREVVYRENGRPLNRWCVCVCRGFRGFGPARSGTGH